MINIFKRFFKRKHSERRAFTQTQKVFLWYNQDSKCKECWDKLDMRTVKYDHIKRYSQGWKTTVENWQALCSNCHSNKTYEENLKLIIDKDATQI